MSDSLFNVTVTLKPEADASPLWAGAPSVADLHLRIMRLEAVLMFCDNHLATLVPLVPGLQVARNEIAQVMERPTGQRIS